MPRQDRGVNMVGHRGVHMLWVMPRQDRGVHLLAQFIPALLQAGADWCHG